MVHVRSGLVHEHHLRVAQHHAGNRKQLALTARQAAARFGDGHVQPKRVVCHNVIDVQGFEHFNDLDIGDPAVGQDQVIAHCAHEQLGILTHIADTAAHFAGLDLLQIHAVKADIARTRCIEARHKAQQGAFAAANTAEHGNFLTRCNLHRQFLDNRNLVLARVGEFECNGLQAALDVFRHEVISTMAAIAWAFHQSIESFEGSGRLLVA